MAVTNLLDRLAEEYEGNHPVEYRAQLSKLGKSIGNRAYSLGGGAKGGSARDIIRKNTNEFPYDILKKKRDRQRVDPQNDYDFKIINKNNGDEHKIEVSSQNELDKKLDLYSAIFNTPKENLVVESNLKNPNVALRNKFQKHDFDKAFSGVRFYRNHDNYYEPAQDILNEPHLTKESYEAMVEKQNDKSRQHSANGWKRYVESRNASRDAGHELGKIFAKKNTLEKNVYGNISKGLKPSTDPVPKGRYKYALGNQNHVYSASPDEPQNDWMNLNPEYHGQPALTNSGHEIHWRKDGSPIIDAYTWTQIPHIDNILKTGYLAIEGADTENFHKGVKGHWTSNKDNTPMNLNYENGMEVGKIGPNGENFNEELLHSRLPLGWFQKSPVIHQGPRGSGQYSVDVIQAKPGAPEVMIGEGDRRRLEKVATPAQFINHIPADKMREDWTMGSNFDYTSQTIPGWHPNKPYVGYTTERAIGRLVPNETLVKMKDEMSRKERVNWFLDQLKDDAGKKSFYQSVLNFEDPLADVSEGLQKDALKQFYENPELENKTAYDIVKMVENPPKVNVGAVTNGTKTPNVWTRVLNGKDFPRTKKYISQQMIDNKPLSRFHYGTHYYHGNSLDIKDSPLQKAFPFGDWKFGQLNIGPNIGGDLFFPKPLEAAKYEERYLKDVVGNIDKYIRERKGYPDRPENTSSEIDRNARQNHKKYMLYELQKNRSKDVVNQIWPKWMKMSADPETHKFDSNSFKDVAEFTKDSPYGTKSDFSFEDWFNDYKKQYGSAAVEKQRIKPVVDLYLDEIKNHPSNKELAKIVVDNAPKIKEEKILADDYKKYMKADSLDKVIGHMIGRRIGADRAKRGKKIF